jgi:hypothetical protein
MFDIDVPPRPVTAPLERSSTRYVQNFVLTVLAMEADPTIRTRALLWLSRSSSARQTDKGAGAYTHEGLHF